jgi:lipopolysaccharide export system permease protein
MRNPIKIIDTYVVKSFIGPFILWTMIALFVLLLQMMWVYIDEIMGKGAGLFFITEMIFYLSVFLVPQALLIGVLTASVMVMGGLAENYELPSMKSAGISLMRVIRPMLVFCISIAIFSYVCGDILSPLAKLKYNARLYDIRRQKPALAIEEGVFSDNFPGYTIRIAKKNNDGRHISDVMIYQASKPTSGGSTSMSEVIAKDGEMYSSEDEQLMIMKLNEGHRYEKAGGDESHRFAFIRTNFKEWNKTFEVSEIERTDERLFGNNQATKTVQRLYHDIDSIGILLYNRKQEFGKAYLNNFTAYHAKDTVKKSPYERDINQANAPSPPLVQSQKKYTVVIDSGSNVIQQDSTQDLAKMGSILATFPKYHQANMITRAKGTAESLLRQAEDNTKGFDNIRLSQAKHICELHTKFLMAMMCIVFVFVGAPMGAIVRKGGFGYPILVAISLFILYIFMYIMFRKLGEQGSLDPALAIWMPALVMGMIGSYLSWHATRDSRVFKTERLQGIVRFFKRLMSKLKRTKA